MTDDELRAVAINLASAQKAKAGDTLAIIKARMYEPTLDLLRDTTNPLD